jgi:hypothetical protein
MADEKPIQNVPDDESKKDTVRINLPQSIAGKPAGGSPTPTVRLKPAGAPSTAGSSEEESKKETAVMGMPAPVAKPKKDTSRVQVPAAKPGVPEMPRPTVKLKREEGSSVQAPAPAPVGAPAPALAPVAAAAGPSGADIGLAIAACVLAVAVAGYLFSLSQG